jgi:TPP-dependent 2-oxoacid decarboxylase
MTKIKTRKKTITIGKYLLDILLKNGVEHIFGLPGDYVLRFDKLIEGHEIQFINATRENTAGFMADTYGRLKGFGAVCITYGVGINITNAVFQAYVENSPLIIISGAPGTKESVGSRKLHHLLNKNPSNLRDVTQLEIFTKITAAQTVLDEPKIAASEINRVLEICFQQKKPVYIEIPRDQVESEIVFPKPYKFSYPESDFYALNEVLIEVTNLLKQCDNPVIWAGHEIQRYDLGKELLQFAEKFRIPIATSLLGKAVVSEFHPLSMGIYQGKMSPGEVREYVENSDCVFLLGVVLSDVDTGLFTSKIKSDKQIFASTEGIKIHHHQYNNVFFRDFMHGLTQIESNVQFRASYPPKINHLPLNYVPKKGKKITTERLFEILQKHLKPEHFIVTDMGDCLFGSSDLILEQNTYFSNAYFATLGFGIPGALGLQFAAPHKRVVAIVGDGAFQMTCMELSTAVRYGLNPIIILLNNHGYGTERPLLEGEFNDIVNWRYTEIPRVLGGGTGIHVTTEDLLEKALSKAFEKRKEFFLIEVDVAKTDFSPALKRFCNLGRVLN